MRSLTDSEIADYFLRSFAAVDGLWFMKIEERWGFEAALETDNEVWKVLPKLQARMLRSLSDPGDGLEALSESLATKFTVEGFRFTVERLADGPGFRVIVTFCPWHERLIRVGRGHISERIGRSICPTEYTVWAAEFGKDIRFEPGSRRCSGDRCCVLKFTA